MVTKALSRPTQRSSHSHTQSHSHPQRSSSRTSSTAPLSPPLRIPPSVGQPLPPTSAMNALRSSNTQTDARTPSPNYFGLIVDPASDPRDSGVGPKDNWSPPTSSILSFGPSSPKFLPIDSNPDFEAFRRQTESNNGFNLSHGSLSQFASTPAPSLRSKPERKSVRPDLQDDPPSPRTIPNLREGSPIETDVDGGRDSAYASSSERASDSSMSAPSFFDMPRQLSPASFTSRMSPVQRNALSRLDDRHSRLSLPQNRPDPPSPHIQAASQPRGAHPRADTLPSALEEGPIMIAAVQLKDMIDRLPLSQFLLLDLRVFPQYSKARIQNALNLCIPTTLLKRPSFNLQKLQDTFTNESEKARFAQWRSAKYIVVYDAFSADKKDAVSAINTLKKFTNEGWKGSGYILRGGFVGFSKHYSQYVDDRSSQAVQSSKISLSLGTSMPDVAPVAGGCVMPATKNAANPFFSNIRQNQDLIGGVGQMDIKMPADLSPDSRSLLPPWLLKASARDDHGKLVSDKFLHIELDEQARMTKALSSGVSYSNTPGSKSRVQIAGIEKGGKNRYNNIWPFEHARVRLQGRPEGACDYVNASHVKASRSNKRYIASQGPLPATFEDFWSVIWDEDVRVIVMLTAESEGGQLKCHPYWAAQEFGPLKLKSLSEKRISLDPTKHRTTAERRSDAGRRRANTTIETSPHAPATGELPYVIVRKFALSHAAHPFSPIREITQLHYSSWPDFGAPASPSQLLGLVELSNLTQRAASSVTSPLRSDDPEYDENIRPMLVHCSAGCGRTGTFCTVDSVIDMLKRQRKEAKAGIVPMDTSSGGDYMSQGRQADSLASDWIFNQDIDLVEKTVEDFRGQRLSMVQSLRQYVLCYETILEWLSQQHTVGPSRPSRDRSGSDTGYMGRENNS